MQKLGFPSLKSLDHFKSLAGSVSATSKTSPFSSRPASDSVSLGGFANLKLTAEKLVKEQASVKTDLEIANTKLNKSTEHIRALEEKFQIALNENAKLKVKQKEDEKRWKGLESKFSSTKALCDQLTETLQHLAGQVQNAEKDKEFLEEKLSVSSIALDGLNQQMQGLSLKLESAEETTRTREKELTELRTEKEEKDKLYSDELCRTAGLLEEKDVMIKKLEATVAANRLETESMNSKLGGLYLELEQKEEQIKQLIIIQQNLEREKIDFQLCKDDLADKLDMSFQEITNLEGLVRLFAEHLVELDRQSMKFSEKFDHLSSLYDSCFKLVQQEKELVAKHAKGQYCRLHDMYLHMISEKDILQLANQELNNKITELQEFQGSVMARLSEECRLAGERIRKLECEAETLVSMKIEAETLVSKLTGKIDTLTESSTSSENKMKDLQLKISELERENKENSEQLQSEIQKKAEEIDILQKESQKSKQHVDLLEKQVNQFHDLVEEKAQLILQYKEREKKLEDHVKENEGLLTTAESKLVEAKKQYDQMLESKQLELSRHLKEISQRNDQAINDIRRKYEVEKQEIINTEKEKAENVVREMERKCDEKLVQSKEEARQHLLHIQEEHATLVSRIQQDHDRRELALKAEHCKELKHAQLQSENELREKTTLLRNEHEVQMRALRCELEDECRKLQEELDLQKSKEERQRALLQLQWRVMSDKPREDQEVNSKKDYSTSSSKKRSSGGSKRSHHAPVGQEEEKDPSFSGAAQTPVSKLLKKVENSNTGSVLKIPNHHKKVTHHEYEVETSNGRTITKRRKTKSTVMFKDPRKDKKRSATKANTPRNIGKGSKGGSQPHPSNIGDLFSEGSLNPYADDPFAFD